VSLLGFVLVAAGQEPLMLRSFGVFLVTEAAWFGGMVVLVLLGLQLPATNNRGVRIAAAAFLALAVAMSTAGLVFGLDGLRRNTWECSRFVATALQFWAGNVGVALAAATWTWRASHFVHLPVQMLVAAVGASRLLTDGCSWSWWFGSIAAASAALATALPDAAARK
jgi:hypothetical protein